jgi:thiol-disulfide isomerase/thioredoxin
MIKLIMTVLLALGLTACDSKENGAEKTFNTHKKEAHQTDTTTPDSLEELQKQVATPATTKTEKKTTPEKFAKDIFTLTTLEGKKLHVDETNEGIRFQGHENRVTFLLFFGYRCPPCLGEIPALISLTKEQHKDLDIIAVEVQRLPEEDLKTFKKMKGINYTLLSGNQGENAQFVSYIGQRAQWGGSIPFLVALNPKSEVKVVHVGGMSLDEFKTLYEKLAKEK